MIRETSALAVRFLDFNRRTCPLFLKSDVTEAFSPNKRHCKQITNTLL